MIAMTKFSFKGLLTGAFLACAFTQAAVAAEVSGVKFDDTAKVAGKDLKLNGAGLRTKFVVKVYAAGLYLAEKKNTVPDIMKVEGPRRVSLVMMRDISSEDLGEAFMTGLNNNVDQNEKARLVTQISKFGEMFGSISSLKKGDVLHLDWIPGSGTHIALNGKKIGDTVAELDFYNALLRIWIGDKPADRSLKPALLGAAR